MNADTASARLLDEREAAAILNISHRTLQYWRVRGGGPRYVKFGRAVRYRRADLLGWIEGCTVESTSAAENA